MDQVKTEQTEKKKLEAKAVKGNKTSNDALDTET